MVGRIVATQRGKPVDWATARALNLKQATLIAARSGNLLQFETCTSHAGSELLTLSLEAAAEEGCFNIVQYLTNLPTSRCVIVHTPGPDRTRPLPFHHIWIHYPLCVAAEKSYFPIVQLLSNLTKYIIPQILVAELVQDSARNNRLSILKWFLDGLLQGRRLERDRLKKLWSKMVVSAAWRGYLEVVTYLCELRVTRRLIQHTPLGLDEPLKLAAAMGHANVVAYLCGLPPIHGVDPSVEGNDPLYQAAFHGHVDVVQILCDLPQPRGVWPGILSNIILRKAVQEGQASVVSLLCRLPLDRDVHPGARNNAALRAAAEAGFEGIVSMLCRLPASRGVQPWAKDNEALIVAASKGHLGVVQCLCRLAPSFRVDPGANNNKALISAAMEGHLSTVTYLCSLPHGRGVNPQACDADALFQAVVNNRMSVVQYLCNLSPPRIAFTEALVASLIEAAFDKGETLVGQFLKERFSSCAGSRTIAALEC